MVLDMIQFLFQMEKKNFWSNEIFKKNIKLITELKLLKKLKNFFKISPFAE